MTLSRRVRQETPFASSALIQCAVQDGRLFNSVDPVGDSVWKFDAKTTRKEGLFGYR